VKSATHDQRGSFAPGERRARIKRGKNGHNLGKACKTGLILQMEVRVMSRSRELIRLQRLSGREELFDLLRQVREKIRRDKETALYRTR
jgi:hypothetical protein